MARKKADFLIIDDSELDCFIAEKIIKQSGVGNEIQSFLSARQALDYIKQTSITKKPNTVIFLDILMPIMSGIEFIEEFEQLPAEVQDKHYIVAFTSSMNKKDISRMKSYKSVRYILDKPLGPEALSVALSDYDLLD